MRTLLIIAVLSFCARGNPIGKNIAYIEFLGTSVSYISLNYERKLIRINSHAIGIEAGIGYSYRYWPASYNGVETRYFCVPINLGVSYLIPIKRHEVQIGLASNLFIEIDHIESASDTYIDGYRIYPLYFINCGYRYYLNKYPVVLMANISPYLAHKRSYFYDKQDSRWTDKIVNDRIGIYPGIGVGISF